jgi:predicted N-acetyltransferase YhbS
MVLIGQEAPAEAGAREALLDRAMGSHRKRKPSERLRAGRLPAEGLSFVARDGSRLVGTVRLWHVRAGDRPALLLGPLAVDPEFQGLGIGTNLMEAAVDRAESAGHDAVILVGDPEYYARFGFAADATAGLTMPGRVERRRFLARELTPGALLDAGGRITPAGALIFPPSSRARRNFHSVVPCAPQHEVVRCRHATSMLDCTEQDTLAPLLLPAAA